MTERRCLAHWRLVVCVGISLLAFGITLQAARPPARAARHAAANLDKTDLYAPCAGIVQEKIAEAGETVGAGAPVVRIVDLDDVWLTVYVPEADVGRVRVGQRVDVMVDSRPGEVFPAFVEHMSSEAEFTPKYVQTPEERSRLVYAVRVRLDNRGGPDPSARIFKPGMPADAVLYLDSAAGPAAPGAGRQPPTSP